MNMLLKSTLFLLALGLFFTACTPTEEQPALVLPSIYTAPSFTQNTTQQAAIRTQMEALVTEIKKGRTPGTVLDGAVLTSLFQIGNPSIKSITTPYYIGRLENTGNWLDELTKSSGNAYILGAPSVQGGTFGGYLFDENALEMEQMIEKGLFGAAMYHHAITLMQGTITLETADQLASIYGAHPDFPNTPTATKAANPDKFMANYAARRDKNDGAGLYTQLKKAFIQLQAAVKAGDDYNTERDEALVSIRQTWEKVNVGTVVNYCHSVIATLIATSPSDSDKAKALHAYGECVGFLHGWRTIPQGYKIMSDAEIDELLTLLNAPYNGTPTSYLFVTDSFNELPKLTQIIDKIKVKYGFTTQEIEDFKKNWVAEQGR
jgi:Domain of unknown function (DUF4856)